MVRDIYLVTARFPKTETYGLTSQIRRAAVSVPANISEGAARGGTKEFRYFLRVSYASLTELETLLILSNDIGILAAHDLESFMRSIKILTVQFNNLINKLDEKIRNQASLS